VGLVGWCGLVGVVFFASWSSLTWFCVVFFFL
jgi:hypothetical protein